MIKFCGRLFILCMVMLLSVPIYAGTSGCYVIGIDSSQNARTENGGLQVVNRWIDFGEISCERPIEATYTLRNKTDSTIEIKSIEPDCVFSGYVVEGYFIKPFEELEITIILNTSIRGYFKNYIIVEADTEQRFYSLVFEAIIK